MEEIQAKSILRKRKKIDSWFITHYGMNLYRGCAHDCAYCDGRAEKYRVEGIFGRDVAEKVNAVDLLRRELDPGRRRKPLKRSYLMLGGGVGDCYQPAEERYRLSRQVLELAETFDFPVHILTKSTMVERDLDLLLRIQRKNGALVSFSFSSIDDDLSAVLEPGVPSPTQRLTSLTRLKSAGIPCGMFLMPVVPFLSDTPELLATAISKARQADLDYIVFGGMTLKMGRQRDHFYRVLDQHFPGLSSQYRQLYFNNRYGQAAGRYYDKLNRAFLRIATQYRMPIRIPLSLFGPILDPADRVVVALEQMDHCLRSGQGRTSPYGRAAQAIARQQQPLPSQASSLRQLPGVSRHAAEVIQEILETGGCALYRRLVLYCEG